MVRSANVRRLHGSSLFGAQQATYHETSFKTKQCAIVADPVFLGELLNPIAALMNRYIAVSAKHNHVFILVVTTITYDTLSIFLGSNGTIVSASTDRLQFLNKFLRSTWVFYHLLKYLFVFVIILSLLRLLNMLQKVFFLSWRISSIKQNLIKASLKERYFSILLKVPSHVLMDFLYKPWINLGQKVLSIITDTVAPIYGWVWLIWREISG